MPLNTKTLQKIQLNVKDIKNTSHFTYLGNVVTSEGGADQNIVGRLGKVREAFVKL